MATNLRLAGLRLGANVLDRAAVQELEGLQARGAADVSEFAAEADVIVTMLPNSTAVREGVAPPAGVLLHAPPARSSRTSARCRPKPRPDLAAWTATMTRSGAADGV